MNVRPIVKYHGGKGRLFQWILESFPEHHTYCEPFGGAASVLLNKEPSKIELYNDIEYTIFNVMRTIRDNYDEFMEKIIKVKYEKETYLANKKIYFSESFKNLDHMEQAIVTYITKRMSRGGTCTTFSWSSRIYSTGPAEVHCWNSAIETLFMAKDRLQGVEIINEKAIDVIQKLDGEKTLFYLDPPYLHSTRKSKDVYVHEMSEEDHVNLADVCSRLKGKVILSGYPSEKYESLYSGWKCEIKDTANHCGHNRGEGSKSRMQECIWKNF
jgi:DNA adenine methylase